MSSMLKCRWCWVYCIYVDARVSCLELLKRVWACRIVAFDKVCPLVLYWSDILVLFISHGRPCSL
jgi:hypothetical protein